MFDAVNETWLAGELWNKNGSSGVTFVDASCNAVGGVTEK